MQVPDSRRWSPLFLGASMTNQSADDDDNIHENVESEEDRMGAR